MKLKANTAAPVFNVTPAIADALVKATGKTYEELKTATTTAKQTQVIKIYC
jgi:hypothetical protein